MKEKYKQYYVGQIVTLKASPDKQLQDKIGRTGYIKNIDDAGQLFVDFTNLALIDGIDEIETTDTNIQAVFMMGTKILKEMSLKEAVMIYNITGWHVAPNDDLNHMPIFDSYLRPEKKNNKLIYKSSFIKA